MTFIRKSIQLAADDKPATVNGTFSWFAVDFAPNTPHVVQKDLPRTSGDVQYVNLSIRPTVGSSITSIGLWKIGDALEVPFVELQISLPAFVTGGRTISLDVLCGHGRIHRAPVQWAAGQHVVTPRAPHEASGYFSQKGTGVTEVISAVSNIAGYRIQHAALTAHGDGAIDGWARISVIDFTTTQIDLASVSCDKSGGPVAIPVPSFDVRAGQRLIITGTSTKDVVTLCGKPL